MPPLNLDRWRHPARIAACVAVVGIVTALIGLLDNWIPVLSLGVLYLFAVLPVAIVWGIAYSLAVSVACMLAFNFFFLEPIHTLTLADSRNWFALVVFVVTSVVVSELATRSRRRAREAELLAGIATSLLEHGTVAAELERISADAARALHAERARITLGDPVEIRVEGGSVDASARRRVIPALASLLGVAVDRERLEREALEAAALRHADALKTALLRAVSHDLRTPLMAISTSAGALARPDLNISAEDREELLETILAASDRLDHLVGNLLDLSRLQAGAAEPEQRLVDFDELVAGALEELGAEGARIDVSLPDDLPPISVDPHQIQRAIVNLLENALKYSPPGEPVRVLGGRGHDEVLLRVIDHGPGVPAADRERIFQPFDRGGRTGDSPGAGLGLAIARGFAEANGGRVSVESRAGQGATFVLAVPETAPVEVHA
jgi:two-component system sensor histidine kinase KdpD